ncbi:MAG TPA: DNA mismatch repair protein [Clostridiales bacterium]|nr:DNA mismatch repair protein [Clostridiales bacterium]
MDNNNAVSILFPYYEDTVYKQLGKTTVHDLGLQNIVSGITPDPKEQQMILTVLSNMTSDRRVALYRQKVFADILALPELRAKMTELFDRIEFLRDYGTIRKNTDESLGLWDLMHRLDTLKNYIEVIEAMREALSDVKVTSPGLKDFKKYIDDIYEAASFAELKKDVGNLKVTTEDIKSVTVGINVNERFEATSLGLISVNDKPFKKSGILGNFADAVATKNGISKGTDWNGDMHYRQVEKPGNGELSGYFEKLTGYMAMQNMPFLDSRIRSTIVNVSEGDGNQNTTFYLGGVVNKLLDTLVKKLKEILSKHMNVAVVNISKLIPEFIYYIRFAEFIEKQKGRGFRFSEAELSGDDVTKGTGIYNLKLALNLEDAGEIVPNDLTFDGDHTIYILTGANRGGKTTITQAVGILFVLAQGGIYIPGDGFRYVPVDSVYTHFPADEDKTMDLGRLGEECVRFKEIYGEATGESLVLLNESFSTTSFEEGYYIAGDSIKALLDKGTRTIFNTHMHKLGGDVESFNEGRAKKASSLIVRSDDGKRSFKVEVAPPEGMSYAKDIAEKYGVTYSMLTGEKEGSL